MLQSLKVCSNFPPDFREPDLLCRLDDALLPRARDRFVARRRFLADRFARAEFFLTFFVTFLPLRDCASAGSLTYGLAVSPIVMKSAKGASSRNFCSRDIMAISVPFLAAPPCVVVRDSLSFRLQARAASIHRRRVSD